VAQFAPEIRGGRRPLALAKGFARFRLFSKFCGEREVSGSPGWPGTTFVVASDGGRTLWALAVSMPAAPISSAASTTKLRRRTAPDLVRPIRCMDTPCAVQKPCSKDGKQNRPANPRASMKVFDGNGRDHPAGRSGTRSGDQTMGAAPVGTAPAVRSLRRSAV